MFIQYFVACTYKTCKYFIFNIHLGTEIAEHAIAITEAEDRSAVGLLKILLDTLETHDISLDCLVSDCLDGASVNSGWRGNNCATSHYF